MGISIGIGSWADRAYTGLLYAPGLPANERLKTYAEHFDHVEVNSSYYATPTKAVVKNWVEQTPPGFTFDIKLHRALSHNPGQVSALPVSLNGKTKNTRDKVEPAQKRDLLSYTLEQLEPLIKQHKMGAFLLMLSPGFESGPHRLEELEGIRSALQKFPLAVELRHRSWIEGKIRSRTLDYFREHGIAWTSVDMPLVEKPGVMPPLDEVTSPKLAYLRLHGRNKKGYLNGKTAAEKHHYLYDEKELKELAVRIKKLSRKADLVRVVANNHSEDFAPRTALALKKILHC